MTDCRGIIDTLRITRPMSGDPKWNPLIQDLKKYHNLVKCKPDAQHSKVYQWATSSIDPSILILGRTTTVKHSRQPEWKTSKYIGEQVTTAQAASPAVTSVQAQHPCLGIVRNGFQVLDGNELFFYWSWSKLPRYDKSDILHEMTRALQYQQRGNRNERVAHHWIKNTNPWWC